MLGAITFYGTIDLILIDQKMNRGRFKTLPISVFPKLDAVFITITWIFRKIMFLFITQER